MKEPKLAHLGKVLYKWFTAIHSKRKPVTEPMIEKAFYDKMKITDKFTFSEGSNKRLPVRTYSDSKNI